MRRRPSRGRTVCRRPRARAAVVLLGLLGALVAAAPARGDEGAPPPASAVWSDAAVERAERLPVMDQGRLRPLRAVAEDRLLRLSGRRGVVSGDGEALSATRWLLEVLFRPEAAARHPVLRLDDDGLAEALGLAAGEAQAGDLLSFADLAPRAQALRERARAAAARGRGERTPLDDALLRLDAAFALHLGLVEGLRFASVRLPVEELPAVAALFGGAREVAFSQVVARLSDLERLSPVQGEAPAGAEASAAQREVQVLFGSLPRVAGEAHALALLPPPEHGHAAPGGSASEAGRLLEPWRTPFEALGDAALAGEAPPEHLALLEALEEVGRAAHALPPAPAAVEAALGRLVAISGGRAAARGEQRAVEREHDLVAGLPARGAPWASLAALVLLALGVGLRARPAARALRALGAATLLLAGGLCAAALVQRGLVLGRPQGVLLVEQALLVAGWLAPCGLALGAWQRRWAPVVAAAALGAGCAVLAAALPGLARGDTLDLLAPSAHDPGLLHRVARLAAPLGWAVALLAGALGHVVLLARPWGGRGAAEPPGPAARAAQELLPTVLTLALGAAVLAAVAGGLWTTAHTGGAWLATPADLAAAAAALLLLLAAGAPRDGRSAQALLAVLAGAATLWAWWGGTLAREDVGGEQGRLLLGFVLRLLLTCEALVLVVGLRVWSGGRPDAPRG